MIILFARIIPTDMDSVCRYAIDDDAPVMQAICETLVYDPLKHMEDVPSGEIKDKYKSSVSFAMNREDEQITAKYRH